MFLSIDYLKTGNERQSRAHEAILESRIFSELASFTPVLCGTIPIEVDIEESDLDIIMEVHDATAFREAVTALCGAYKGFHMQEQMVHDLPTIIANFECAGFPFELFGQPRAIQQQNAYRHMIVEYALLLQEPHLKQEVIRLKKQGIKTEPAFAQILQLKGDPHEELLRLGERMGII